MCTDKVPGKHGPGKEVVGLERQTSFGHVDVRLEEVTRHAPPTTARLLVGNKCDCDDAAGPIAGRRVIPTTEGQVRVLVWTGALGTWART